MKVLVVAVLLALQSSLPITFEDGRVPGRITDQYPGISFNAPWLVDYAAAGAPGFPHSGTHALTLCHERQPCRDTTFVLTFPRPQQRVKVWAGVPGLSAQTIFVIEAYDSLGTFMGNSGAGVNPGRLSRIELPLEVHTDSNQISSVRIMVQGAFIPGFAIDDIEFARAGDAPESAARPDVDIRTDPSSPTPASRYDRWPLAFSIAVILVGVAWLFLKRERR